MVISAITNVRTMISRYSGSKTLRYCRVKAERYTAVDTTLPERVRRIRSSGTKKKSPSHTVTGESKPASLKVQPRPSLPMLVTLYRGKEGRVLASRLPNVLDDLQPLEDTRF